MLIQPRFIAFLLALCIALATSAFCTLIPGTPTVTIALTFLVAITSSFLLIFFTIEYLIFRELGQVQALFDRLKKKDFKLVKGEGSILISPIKDLRDEISLFATVKQKEIEELKKIEIYRREFIADLSHELKTPIFAAQGFIHTLLDGAMEEPEVAEKFLKKAAKSLDGLDELVQDLIMLSEFETGGAKMHKEAFDVMEVVQEVFDQLEKKAAKKNITLLSDRSVEKPLLVDADRKRVFQALRNLVENGIKYGNENGIVKVNAVLEKDAIELQVSDNGPGISEDDQKRIFERFYRIEKSRSKDKGGSGLGLAIVKQIVEAHKSRIFVESKVGKGSVFYFKLPRRKTA